MTKAETAAVVTEAKRITAIINGRIEVLRGMKKEALKEFDYEESDACTYRMMELRALLQSFKG